MSVEQFAFGIPSAARFLDVDRKTLDAAIARQELPARRVGPKGGRWSVERDDLIAWYRGLSRETREDDAS
jgi:hypothetical protein